MSESKKENPVIQSNDLVRAIPFEDNSLRMTGVQKKASWFIFSKVHKDLCKLEGKENWYRLKVSEMANFCFHDENAGGYQTSKCLEQLEEFRSKSYHLKITYQDENGATKIRRTSLILEIDNPIVASGYLDVHLSDVVISNIKNLDRKFTYFLPKHGKELSSYNQTRLFELLMSWLDPNTGKGQWDVTPSNFRKLMNIKSSQYQKFSHLKRSVIDNSLKAINSNKTNLNVSVQIERIEFGKPSMIKFKITQNDFKPSKTKLNHSEYNKKYWETHENEFTGLSYSTAYLQDNQGNTITWTDKDFLTKIEKYKKTEDSKSNELPRETNIFVEAMRLMTANQARQRIVNRINQKKEQGIYTNWRVDEMRHKGTNPEAIAVFLVGRASKENEPELEDIYTEIYGEGWREEANRRLEKRGVNL